VRVFFYMGRNSLNRSGLSWKIWKISRSGRTVTTHWGPAVLSRRKVVPSSYLRSKIRKFRTLREAIAFEASIIESKLKKGYQRRTRWR